VPNPCSSDARYFRIRSLPAVSDKLKALLAIAGKVQLGGKQVTSEDIARATQQGATGKEIHDAVLIAAAFCMYNRYVDGLATWQPLERDAYRDMGEQLAREGYVRDRFQEGQKAAQA
jgi:alkylhydroperoxidase/carboxymuconolactone decarboxylase family protein YurZ